ncbi:MAG TPA: hypothetical protein VLI90_20635, partial [Tepidisphaeraceae bacterium]|nr:hypothetical protein [Tepidisphaeraceae bacterium]
MQTATVAQGRSISDQIGSNHTRRARSARRALLLAAAAVTVGSVAQSSHATSYNWDPGHVAATTGGGTGTWDTASSNWFNSTDQVWPNTNPNTDNAIFGNAATAATVTIQGASAAALNVFANQVTFSSANYTLTGSAGSTLTLSGTAPAISTSGGTAAISVPIVLGANANFTTTNTLTLNSGAVISGNFGITHVGPGFLTLVSNSSFSGGINNISGSIGLQIAPTTSTASAIGSGTFTSAGGVSMNNNLTSTAIQLINNLQSYSAATNVLFSAGSTPYLNMGTGAATLTGNTTFSVRFGSVGSGQTPGGTFVIGGNVGETGGSFGITMGSPATVNSVANVIA